MSRKFQNDVGRVYVLMALVAGLWLLLLGTLYVRQVSRGHEYERSLRRQSMRRVRLPAVRGRILDRHGVCLADCRPSYCLALYLEELRRPGPWKATVAAVVDVLEDLTVVLGRPPAITEADIWSHIRKRLPLPLIAWRDLDDRELARFAEGLRPLKGVDVIADPVRRYPHGALAAHVLGYVGKAEPAAGAEDYQFHLPELEGRAGLEARCNEVLRGVPGGRLVRVDAAGFKYAEKEERQPQRGADVITTLDVRIQRLAEAALEGVRGAVVVLDSQEGDVLAMASAPTFDPNQFVPRLLPEVWQQLNADPDKPLLNRAVSELYAPGSVFKPIVALAALQSGRATPSTTFECPGYFELGSYRLGCWNPAGHGRIAMREALEQSCNSYFAALGLLCGPEAIAATARELGLGARTGVGLDPEAAGVVPDPAWKLRRHRDAWRPGDTCNYAIGQGPVAVTVLQMAVVTAALANGGTVLTPRLVRGVRAADDQGTQWASIPPPRRVARSTEALTTVREGMLAVVMAPAGTGSRARVAGVSMAGKTGTAEYGSKEEGRKYGWMVVFAPFDDPRYAVAMVVEDAVSGGITVAPRIRELMSGILQDGAGEG